MLQTIECIRLDYFFQHLPIWFSFHLSSSSELTIPLMKTISSSKTKISRIILCNILGYICFKGIFTKKVTSCVVIRMRVWVFFFRLKMSCDNSTNIFLLGLASSMKTDIRTSDINVEQLMTFAYAFSVTSLVAFGLTSNLISIDVFRQIQVRSATVGFYLLIYSCCSIFGLLMLECRLFQLIDTLTYIPFFIICNVISGLASIFTRLCLWLNGFIALQRSFHSFENHRFLNRIRSRGFAMKHIIITMIVVFSMHIHELICRVTLPDPVAEGKYVCRIQYSKELLLLNQIFSLCHLFIPFLFHLISIGLIIALISSRRARIHQTTYWNQWIKQFHTHAHLFLAPITSMVREIVLEIFIE